MNIHVITSYGKGGNGGKSTLALMLLAYLCSQGHQGTVVVIDATDAPANDKNDEETRGTNVYSCIYNIFNPQSAPNITTYPINGCSALRVPFNNTSNDALIAISTAAKDANNISWPELLDLVKATIQYLQRNHKISHVILETNRNLGAGDAVILSDLSTLRGFARMWQWVVWAREALHDPNLYQKLQGFQAALGLNCFLIIMHNPWGDPRPNNGQDMPAIQDCYGRAGSIGPDDASFIQIMSDTVLLRAQEASQPHQNLIGNDYWAYVYQDFRNRDTGRPSRLLPVYRRGNTFYDYMSKQFLNLRHEHGPRYAEYMTKVLELYTDGMYSEIFSKYFTLVSLRP